MVMRLALELHTTEEEVLSWELDKYQRWVAFFKMRDAELTKRTAPGPKKPRRSRT